MNVGTRTTTSTNEAVTTTRPPARREKVAGAVQLAEEAIIAIRPPSRRVSRSRDNALSTRVRRSTQTSSARARRNVQTSALRLAAFSSAPHWCTQHTMGGKAEDAVLLERGLLHPMLGGCFAQQQGLLSRSEQLGDALQLLGRVGRFCRSQPDDPNRMSPRRNRSTGWW